MNETDSITEELRKRIKSADRRDTIYEYRVDFTYIADDIDECFDHELRAKQKEIDGLKDDNTALRAKIGEREKLASKQTDDILKLEHRVRDLKAKLDASIPLPVDADGVPTAIEDTIYWDDAPETHCSGNVIGIVINGNGVLAPRVVGGREPSRWTHAAPEPSETIEDILRDADIGPTKTITEDGTSVNLSPVAMRIIKANKRIFAKRGYIAGFRDGAGGLA